ncbi:MAG: glycoside hydrolase family 3 C-terminal domain-containing protein [Candidatus Pseudomonas colombiensis]|nr:MAG: glycoside hydrolase family 3 C-terminal domain-containing protein [Pseudomonas sp.]
MTDPHAPLLARMSVADKVKLLSGQGLWRSARLEHLGIDDFIMTDGTYGVRYSTQQIEDGASWSFEDFIQVVNQSSGDTPQPSGSEALFSASKPATCFPNGSSLACSWDLDLVYRMGQALGVECQHFGVGLLLGPGINIRRTPLAGRGYEYYSEDPILSGELAGALINGLQDQGVGASLKHFACNNSEYRRTEMDSVVDERALREIYLAGYKRAIDRAQPWTLMSSYNRLNGVQTSQHHWLLTQVLRDEWQYPGLVMSDWYGIKDRPASLLAGNDLGMPQSQRDQRELLAAIEQGRVPPECLDLACRRMLTLIDKVQRGRKPETRANFNQHHELAQSLAAESLVLLKNQDQLLPLCPRKTPRIAVLGKPAQAPVIQGSGCATTRPYLLDRPLDEIFELGAEAFDIRYAVGTPDDHQLDPMAMAQALDTARTADVAILFVSTAIGEDGENGDRQNLDILPSHEQLIIQVAKVQPNVVVVLANSDAVVMPWLDQAKAVLETFFAGQGMGRAVAQALFGLVNPSGKLTVSVPHCLEHTPAFLTYPGENLQQRYSEGLFVGYRYYDKRRLEPLFPFGFGLSYTHFEYHSLATSSATLEPGQALTVTVELGNSGERFGKEVVQLYLAPPACRLPREVQALKAFAKVALEPGQRRCVELHLDWQDFAYYDPAFARWVVDSGEYQVRVGGSSRHIELVARVQVQAPVLYPPVNLHSSLVQLLDNPPLFERVAKLVADKSGMPEAHTREKLRKIAPELFCGLLITLTEMLELDISREELAAALDAEAGPPAGGSAMLTGPQ